MVGDGQDELARLRLSVDRLAQGLQLMVETQQTHSEMLRELLMAAAAPEPKNSPLSDALSEVAATLREQMTSLNAVQQTLRQLPAGVGAAVTQSLQAVLSEL